MDTLKAILAVAFALAGLYIFCTTDNIFTALSVLSIVWMTANFNNAKERSWQRKRKQQSGAKSELQTQQSERPT